MRAGGPGRKDPPLLPLPCAKVGQAAGWTTETWGLDSDTNALFSIGKGVCVCVTPMHFSA